MDAKDRLLLTLLRRDARQPVVALARELNLSRSATQDRLSRLRDSGVIAGFTITEGAAAERPQSAYVTVTFEPSKRCANVVPQLKRIAAVSMIHSITGPADLIIRVDGRDVADIEAARGAIAATPGVHSVSTAVVLERWLG